MARPATCTFAQQVISVVRAIPPGQTMSYQAVAAAAGNPRAARAVANLMARNFDPSVPCHRVIRSDGSLGGYNRGGQVGKRARLRAEGAIL
ncbi:MAG: MGMT family protein [Patescibacteria group bacterium]